MTSASVTPENHFLLIYCIGISFPPAARRHTPELKLILKRIRCEPIAYGRPSILFRIQVQRIRALPIVPNVNWIIILLKLIKCWWRIRIHFFVFHNVHICLLIIMPTGLKSTQSAIISFPCSFFPCFVQNPFRTYQCAIYRLPTAHQSFVPIPNI